MRGAVLVLTAAGVVIASKASIPASQSDFAKCRVLTASWDGNDKGEVEKSGYGYKQNLTSTPYEAAAAAPAAASQSDFAKCRVLTASWDGNDKGEVEKSGYGYKQNLTSTPHEAAAAAPAAASQSDFAKCRVLTASWDGNDKGEVEKSGYGYKQNLPSGESGYASSGDGPLSESSQHGKCELKHFTLGEVNRSFALGATAPFVIRGATDGWHARERWELDRLLADHGGKVFRAGPRGEETVRELLGRRGVYQVGQMSLPHDCYSDGLGAAAQEVFDVGESPPGVPELHERRYSPFIHDLIATDTDIPQFLLPLRVLQMGISNGSGTGVEPEEHPSAWWAHVKGSKRWAFHPPNGEAPPNLFTERLSCAIPKRMTTTVLCDVDEGSIVWVPSGWWHETCTLTEASVGVGGLTYDYANAPLADAGSCSKRHGTLEQQVRPFTSMEYQIRDIPFCRTSACPSLPVA